MYCYQQVEYFYYRDPLLIELQSKLSQLHPRFINVHLMEGNKSYTINKERVFICVKDRNGKYYDKNMLVYVICHEYAHILCNEIGHTNQFFTIFEELLKNAEKMNLYDPNIPPLTDYCGHT